MSLSELVDDLLEGRSSFAPQQLLVVGQHRGRHGPRGFAHLQSAKVEIEDVGVMRRILRTDLLQTRAADQLDGRVGRLPQEVNRAGGLQGVWMKRSAQKDIGAERTHRGSPLFERLSARIEEGRDDECDLGGRVPCPRVDDRAKLRRLARSVHDDVGTNTILQARRFGPRTDRKALDHLALESLLQAQRFLNERFRVVLGAQAAPCPILLERYSSR